MALSDTHKVWPTPYVVTMGSRPYRSDSLGNAYDRQAFQQFLDKTYPKDPGDVAKEIVDAAAEVAGLMKRDDIENLLETMRSKMLARARR